MDLTEAKLWQRLSTGSCTQPIYLLVVGEEALQSSVVLAAVYVVVLAEGLAHSLVDRICLAALVLVLVELLDLLLDHIVVEVSCWAHFECFAWCLRLVTCLPV